jgi:formiminotetrahydrofolate cyclodeaminase
VLSKGNDVPFGRNLVAAQSLSWATTEEKKRKRYVLAAAMVTAIAVPALADDVGVKVGPVGDGDR